MAQPLRKPEKETSSYAKRIRDFVEFDCVEGARRLVAEAIRQGDESEELLRWQRLLGPARSRDSSDELQLDRTHELRLRELAAETAEIPLELPKLPKLLGESHCNLK